MKFSWRAFWLQSSLRAETRSEGPAGLPSPGDRRPTEIARPVRSPSRGARGGQSTCTTRVQRPSRRPRGFGGRVGMPFRQAGRSPETTFHAVSTGREVSENDVPWRFGRPGGLSERGNVPFRQAGRSPRTRQRPVWETFRLARLQSLRSSKQDPPPRNPHPRRFRRRLYQLDLRLVQQHERDPRRHQRRAHAERDESACREGLVFPLRHLSLTR